MVLAVQVVGWVVGTEQFIGFVAVVGFHLAPPKGDTGSERERESAGLDTRLDSARLVFSLCGPQSMDCLGRGGAQFPMDQHEAKEGAGGCLDRLTDPGRASCGYYGVFVDYSSESKRKRRPLLLPMRRSIIYIYIYIYIYLRDGGPMAGKRCCTGGGWTGGGG